MGLSEAMQSIRQLAAQEALQLNPLEAAHVRLKQTYMHCNPVSLTFKPMGGGLLIRK